MSGKEGWSEETAVVGNGAHSNGLREPHVRRVVRRGSGFPQRGRLWPLPSVGRPGGPRRRICKRSMVWAPRRKHGVFGLRSGRAVSNTRQGCGWPVIWWPRARDSGGPISPFGSSPTKNRLSDGHTQSRRKDGPQTARGLRARGTSRGIRRAWFDGWTEGVIWTLAKAVRALREAGQSEAVASSVIRHVSSDMSHRMSKPTRSR